MIIIDLSWGIRNCLVFFGFFNGTGDDVYVELSVLFR